MIEVNLVSDVKRELLKTRRVRNAVISVAILVGSGAIGLAVVLGVVFGGQLAIEAAHEGSIDQKAKELMSVDDLDKTVTIQRQITKMNEQHQGKKINSRLFALINAINPTNENAVRFSSVRLNPEEKTIAIEGSASNGYVAVEALKKTILNTNIEMKKDDNKESVHIAQSITDGDTSLGEDTNGKKVLRFSFSFTYADELFAVAKDGVKIITPEKQIDVTDSRLGVPASLFAKRPSDVSDNDNKQEGQ